MKTILIIEDEKRIVKLVRDYMKEHGFRILSASDGAEGLAIFRAEQPAVILLDIMLPEKDGMDVAREIRRESDTPIIMLTARTEEADRVAGLEIGADDYVTKPFSLRELSARIKAVLRRSNGEFGSEGRIERGKLEIDTEAHEVTISGEKVDLTPTEFELLLTMARHPRRAYSRKQLLEAIGHYPSESMERTIDTHVKNIRKKLEAHAEESSFIETEHGIGYRFAGEEK